MHGTRESSAHITVRSASTLNKYVSLVGGTGHKINLILCWKGEGRLNGVGPCSSAVTGADFLLHAKLAARVL